MGSKIDVPLPQNIAPQNLHYYKGYTTYEWTRPKIRYLKKAFIGFSGFCLNKNGLIKECHHAYPFQYDYYLNEAEFFYHDAEKNPEHLITLDNEQTYLVIHHPWFNYYHWLCESIFRLWMVRKKIKDLILVLPEYYRHADFITGSLAPFNIKRIFYIPENHSLLVRNLCLPQLKPLCDSYSKIHVKQVSNFYRKYVSVDFPQQVPIIERLYVSRALAPRRKIVNELEVTEIMIKYGFSIFNPENFTFLQQVAIFSKVKYLAGMHGSGLTNILFMDSATSVLELIKNKTNDLDHPSFLFWYLAQTLHINYYHQICESSGEEDYFNGDYLVDLQLLEKNLILMLSNK